LPYEPPAVIAQVGKTYILSKYALHKKSLPVYVLGILTE